jgi:hypothetical protein
MSSLLARQLARSMSIYAKFFNKELALDWIEIADEIVSYSGNLVKKVKLTEDITLVVGKCADGRILMFPEKSSTARTFRITDVMEKLAEDQNKVIRETREFAAVS